MYQISFLEPLNTLQREIEFELADQAAELGIDSKEIIKIDQADLGKRNRKYPTVVVFFGYASASDADYPILLDLTEDSVVIIPIVKDLQTVGDSTLIVLNSRSQVPLGRAKLFLDFGSAHFK